MTKTRVILTEAVLPDGDRLVAQPAPPEPASEFSLAAEHTAFNLDELEIDASMSSARALVPQPDPNATNKFVGAGTHRVIVLPERDPDASACAVLEEALLLVEVAITVSPEQLADMVSALERRGAALKNSGHVSASQMFAAKRDILVDLALGRRTCEVPDRTSRLRIN